MDLEFFKLLLQYNEMRQRVEPLVPLAGRKLVNDLLNDNCTPRRLGQICNRSPSYMLAVSNGTKSLNSLQLGELIKYAMRSGEQQNASTE